MFLKIFLKTLGHLIVCLPNDGYKIREQSCTRKQGIMTCIFNGGKKIIFATGD